MYPNNVQNSQKSLIHGIGRDVPMAMDFGPKPFVVNIDRATKQNQNYRTTLWTGEHLQATLMCIPCGGDIGLEIHTEVDQFIRVEDGTGIVQMGCGPNQLEDQQGVDSQFAVFIPAGTWHNVINTGNEPLKLYTIYAPPHHPMGTIHRTKEAAQREEEKSNQ